MKTNLSVEIKPFEVPSVVSVYVPDTGCNCVSLHVTSLSPQDLYRLCDDFRAQVFKKANAEMPPEAAATPRCKGVPEAQDALCRLREMLDEGVILGDCRDLTQAIAKVLLQL